MCKHDRWDLGVGLQTFLMCYDCRTCVLHVPPIGNSENTEYVSILCSNFIHFTGVSMISDHFSLWEAKENLLICICSVEMSGNSLKATSVQAYVASQECARKMNVMLCC